MKKKNLGSTDILVSPLGLGTVKFGRNEAVKYPVPFDLPSDDTILSLLDCCESLGINLLDTAPAYGTSEARLGKLLGNRRQQFVLSTKVGETFIAGKSRFDFSASAVKASIEESLRRLKTDYLDIVLVHSNGFDEKIILETDIFVILQKLKEQGDIRAFGMSTKTVAGGQLAVAHSDVVMVTYNPDQLEEKSVIEYAHAQQKGVFIKKALMSGHATSMEAALQFSLAEPGVSSVVIGTLSEDHLRQNVSLANKRKRSFL